MLRPREDGSAVQSIFCAAMKTGIQIPGPTHQAGCRMNTCNHSSKESDASVNMFMHTQTQKDTQTDQLKKDKCLFLFKAIHKRHGESIISYLQNIISVTATFLLRSSFRFLLYLIINFKKCLDHKTDQTFADFGVSGNV